MMRNLKAWLDSPTELHHLILIPPVVAILLTFVSWAVSNLWGL